MKDNSCKVNLLHTTKHSLQRWKKRWGWGVEILFCCTGAFFAIKLILPDLPVLSEIRISVFVFTLFALLFVRNAILEKSAHPDRWTALGFVSLIYLLFWYVATVTFPEINLIRPPLLSFAGVLFLLLLCTPLIQRIFSQCGGFFARINDRVEDEEQERLKLLQDRLQQRGRKKLKLSQKTNLFQRWVQREGMWHIIALLGILFFSALSTLLFLGKLSPTGDEYRHLMAAKHFLADGYFEYNGTYLTTYIIISLQWLFHTTSLFILRLPFALMGIGSVILFYFIGRTVHRSVGLLSAYLIATLPLAIGLARYIREYEIGLFVGAALLLLVLHEKFSGFPWRIATAVAIFGILDYLNNDPHLHASFLFFLLFAGLMILFEILERILPARRYIFASLIVIPITIATVLFILPYVTDLRLHETPEFNYLFLFNNVYSDASWYAHYVPFFIPIAFLLLGIVRRRQRSMLLTLFIITSLVLIIYIYYFDASRRFQVRYIYLLLPFIIPLLASGIHFSWIIIRRLLSRTSFSFQIIMGLIFLFLIFSPTKGLLLTMEEEDGTNKATTQIAYYNDKKLIRYMNEHAIDPKTVLTTTPWVLGYYYDLPFLKTDAEKSRYLHFPWSFEYVDRETIYGINGYWARQDILQIQEIVQNNHLKYVIVHALPKNKGAKYKPEYLPEKLPALKLQAMIDGDKTFGYYIYRVHATGFSTLQRQPENSPLTPGVSDTLIPE